MFYSQVVPVLTSKGAGCEPNFAVTAITTVSLRSGSLAALKLTNNLGKVLNTDVGQVMNRSLTYPLSLENLDFFPSILATSSHVSPVVPGSHIP